METVNQEVATEKTFTQEEVNSIVGERLKRESAKYADYDDLKAKASKFDELEEANKSELQKMTEKNTALSAELEAIKKANEIRDMKAKVAQETGVPTHLLNADTEEDCRAMAEAIKNFKMENSYPAVKDEGEVHYTGSKSTSEQFGEWMNQIL